MIIKSLPILYLSTVTVYPHPASVIDFQYFNCINCKVPEKEKKNRIVTPKARWRTLT